jgi:hypothetical protein
MALDPIAMTVIILVGGLDHTIAQGALALVLEMAVVAALLLWTAARWGDLSRRRA